MAAMQLRHPGVFERLAALGDTVFLIDPVDLPFRFLLSPGSFPPRLDLVGEDAPPPAADATIRGPFLALAELLEGRTDGDALFFARDIVIEGDTEAILALRNAVDSAEIDLARDLLPSLGPLDGVLRRSVGVARAVFRRASRDLEILRGAIVGPYQRSCERMDERIRDLEREIADLRRDVRRRQPVRGAAIRGKTAINHGGEA